MAGTIVRTTGAPGAYVYAYEAETGDRLLLQDGVSGTVVWQSERLGFRPGFEDSLIVADVDGDGLDEIVVNTGRGVVVFENGRIFSDGLESGDLCAWSLALPGEPVCAGSP